MCVHVCACVQEQVAAAVSGLPRRPGPLFVPVGSAAAPWCSPVSGGPPATVSSGSPTTGGLEAARGPQRDPPTKSLPWPTWSGATSPPSLCTLGCSTHSRGLGASFLASGSPRRRNRVSSFPAPRDRGQCPQGRPFPWSEGTRLLQFSQGSSGSVAAGAPSSSDPLAPGAAPGTETLPIGDVCPTPGGRGPESREAGAPVSGWKGVPVICRTGWWFCAGHTAPRGPGAASLQLAGLDPPHPFPPSLPPSWASG
ncbi:hypothetical protein HJG60_009624 [Phyllostomus discolor]|uniref:Uncharacterized protein n=1 Tax=Phyllostomus discolor TaxID=89673 RepID=A0A833Y3K7_9CHIR|nr:hypothetical protein HJG60_009624 [Phyllostomus discolor]